MTGPAHIYALALGSNRPLSRRLTPDRLLEAAAELIGQSGHVHAISPIFPTPPIGPSQRIYANGALLVESDLLPDAMLAHIHRLEHALGRRRFRRWGARSIDIDIILWSGGRWDSRSLHIPHIAFHSRDFVLRPLKSVAAHWRDPVSGLRVRHLYARLQKATPIMRSGG